MARRDYFYDPEAPKPNSIRPATAVALFNSNGELLLLHRKDNDKWTMPGGTLDFGESLTHATPESDRGKFSMIGSSDRSSPRSPVRMRIASWIGTTKTRPSFSLPVRALRTMA